MLSVSRQFSVRREHGTVDDAAVAWGAEHSEINRRIKIVPTHLVLDCQQNTQLMQNNHTLILLKTTATRLNYYLALLTLKHNTTL